MQSAVLLCLTKSREAAPAGARMRAPHNAPYGRVVGRGGEPKEALGEGFPADTRSLVVANG